jgi:hypothetical protein
VLVRRDTLHSLAAVDLAFQALQQEIPQSTNLTASGWTDETGLLPLQRQSPRVMAPDGIDLETSPHSDVHGASAVPPAAGMFVAAVIILQLARGNVWQDVKVWRAGIVVQRGTDPARACARSAGQ